MCHFLETKKIQSFNQILVIVFLNFVKNTYNKHRPLTNTILWIESYKLIIVLSCNT